MLTCLVLCVAEAISVQPADSEADPSDVEEDVDLHEDDDAASKTHEYSLLYKIVRL